MERAVHSPGRPGVSWSTSKGELKVKRARGAPGIKERGEAFAEAIVHDEGGERGFERTSPQRNIEFSRWPGRR
jgi:hypothetical protein